MINEKLLEILVIYRVFEEFDFDSEKYGWTYRGNLIDTDKLNDRYTKLIDEFLKPYVIDTTSKES